MSADLSEYARQLVAGWPRLTAEQAAKIAVLLRGGPGSTKPANLPMTAEERLRTVELLRPTARRLSSGGAA